MPRSVMPSFSVFNFFICGTGILAFILIAIFPYHVKLRGLEAQIGRIEERIEEQKNLLPLYVELIEESENAVAVPLSCPPLERLARRDIDRVAADLSAAAQENHILVENISPDVVSLTAPMGHLKVETMMRGPFDHFRNYLLSLGKIPYLERIERIRIRSLEGSEDLEYNLTAWMAQTKTQEEN